jgi:nicotinate phosphoribosyltransferase
MAAMTTSQPTNPLVGPLLTDFYQISMAYSYWRHDRHEVEGVFELYFRQNPFGGEFTVFAGLDECIRYLESFKVTDTDIAYLKTLLPRAEPGFFDWLRALDASDVTVHAVREGTVVFPKCPLLRVHGPIGLAQLLETSLLNLVNFASLVTTNAARMRLAAGPDCRLLEFGLRRAQGPDGGVSVRLRCRCGIAAMAYFDVSRRRRRGSRQGVGEHDSTPSCRRGASTRQQQKTQASRYAFVGGFDGTSNVLAGKIFRDLPVSGTHGHSYVQAHRSREDLPADCCVEINLGDDVAALAPSSGEERGPPRHRAGVASMAWRTTRRFSTNAS